MLDICGNIKITDDKRFAYLIYCIRSYAFLKDHCKFLLSIDGISEAQRAIVKKELSIYDYVLMRGLTKSYGENYCELLKEGDNPFVINFMEDQFMLSNDSICILNTLKTMRHFNVSVCKSSFFNIEQNSIKTVDGIKNTYGFIYDNHEYNFMEYKKYYGERYYLGVNFITTRDFALKFWNRDLGNRPHAYEVVDFSKEWEHRCMIPNKEIQCAIDDSHGEPGTALIERNEQKYDTIISHT